MGIVLDAIGGRIGLKFSPFRIVGLCRLRMDRGSWDNILEEKTR